MSYLIATVSTIQNCDSLHHITFDCNGHTLSMISLELPQGIKMGKKVKLVIKATYVALAKEFRGLVSYANQLPMTVHSVNNGTLLSSITLEFNDTFVESIIMRDVSESMSLTVGDSLTAFIKASEIAICEVLDD